MDRWLHSSTVKAMLPVCSTSKSCKFEERSRSLQNTTTERDQSGATTASNTDTDGLSANVLKSAKNGNHGKQECTAQHEKCGTCGGEHQASDHQCPKWLEEVNRIRNRRQGQTSSRSSEHIHNS